MIFQRTLAVVVLLLSALAAGCNGRSYQVASPVLGPVPPRDVAKTIAKLNENTGLKTKVRAQDNEIAMVAHQEIVPLRMTDVVAEVNGEPILAHEIFDRYGDKLKQAEEQLKAEEFRNIQLELVKKELPTLIERTLMVDAMKQTMKPEQLEQVDAQLDKFFEAEVQRMMQQSNSKSPTELESQLQRQGMSLVSLRKQFGDNQIAGQYLRSRLGKDPSASREEMLALYEEEKATTYTEKSEIKWQQIELSYEERGGIEQAETAGRKLMNEIRAGKITFDEAAHDRSDSAIASRGGHRDWTQPESLADEDLRAALTALDVNEISDLIPQKSSFTIVMLTGRRKARVIPFNEVQTELHEKIVKQKKDAVMKEVIEELKTDAVIRTILDEEA
jgi:parvulin-like peptidyl-prolyl isomerase